MALAVAGDRVVGTYREVVEITCKQGNWKMGTELIAGREIFVRGLTFWVYFRQVFRSDWFQVRLVTYSVSEVIRFWIPFVWISS